jgi:D-serine deaminase-like pyridoxal phosphate-dependent protein
MIRPVSPADPEIQTPCLLLDAERLAANGARMRERAKALGVGLRPHLKTAKSISVANVLLGDGPRMITVSTLAEARYFTSLGISDILYAVCVTPTKLTAVADIVAQGSDLAIITDDPTTARAIAAYPFPRSVRVLIEIDVGEHRGGVAPDSALLLAIGKELANGSAAHFAGVIAHSGHTYRGKTPIEMAEFAETERAGAVLAARRLATLGLVSMIVSVGSTPAALHARSLKGVTEMRPGVYTFGDLFQAAIGSCREEDLALSVLTEVIGRRPDQNRLLLDAGALALSKDRSMDAIDPTVGFGMVTDLDGGFLPGRMRVDAANQEHGIVAADGVIDFDAFPVGRRLRILPVHCCLTAAAHPGYHVLRDGRIEAFWERINGW